MQGNDVWIFFFFLHHCVSFILLVNYVFIFMFLEVLPCHSSSKKVGGQKTAVCFKVSFSSPTSLQQWLKRYY